MIPLRRLFPFVFVLFIGMPILRADTLHDRALRLMQRLNAAALRHQNTDSADPDFGAFAVPRVNSITRGRPKPFSARLRVPHDGQPRTPATSHPAGRLAAASTTIRRFVARNARNVDRHHDRPTADAVARLPYRRTGTHRRPTLRLETRHGIRRRLFDPRNGQPFREHQLLRHHYGDACRGTQPSAKTPMPKKHTLWPA